ncbi:hypothetical protein MG068_08455 [Stenotrophomonas sp. ASS1]|uniref:Uncharacterized protein n=1 Tax=Stenotrophomonas maltophilia TaxID=40324 RepID=A0AAI9FU79_STEMA|nr:MULTISPECIES: hypothetical protein [unclassified Stenotrophomonas]EKT4091569.1 hypothetical protein [Stenotrophomonas maltophilia]MRI41668.1 hypothetical protein [Stenotrophomonas sp. MH181796]QBL40537.1 hypothetical protein MG068_08455 [Stenotrophomonas sp. ASS1]
MVRGVRIRSTVDSLVQIDPSYENLALKTSGAVTTVVAGSTPGLNECGIATITVAGCNNPVLAIRCDSNFVGLLSRTSSGGTYTWKIIANTPVVTVSYWVFDTTDVAQMQFNTTRGMRVRNPANNRVVFDSRYKYLRVIAMANSTQASTHPMPQADGFCVALSNVSVFTAVTYIGAGGGPQFWTRYVFTKMVGFRTVAGAVETQGFDIYRNAYETPTPSPMPPPAFYGSYQAIGMVADVRNY